MTHVFRLARTNGVQTVAIPAVGTGIAGFPMDECARTMARSLAEAFAMGWEPEEVRFVLYGNDARHVFEVAFHATFEA
jgi:O-acetyl-ADP-ribose deacetylase (regulator of RNase III)